MFLVDFRIMTSQVAWMMFFRFWTTQPFASNLALCCCCSESFGAVGCGARFWGMEVEKRCFCCAVFVWVCACKNIYMHAAVVVAVWRYDDISVQTGFHTFSFSHEIEIVVLQKWNILNNFLIIWTQKGTCSASMLHWCVLCGLRVGIIPLLPPM